MTLRDHIYSNIALPVDKDLESKIQDDLWLDQECYSETEVAGTAQGEGLGGGALAFVL